MAEVSGQCCFLLYEFTVVGLLVVLVFSLTCQPLSVVTATSVVVVATVTAVSIVSATLCDYSL